MPIQVLMPALSPTMEKGNLAKWLKAVGDHVKAGDVIAEIETDKATMEVEAVDDGTLGQILIPEGTADVAVNTPIAVILSEGEDRAALMKSAVKKSGAQAAARPVPAPQASAMPAAVGAAAYDASNEIAAGTEFTTMTVREALRDRSEERRVGKECRL